MKHHVPTRSAIRIAALAAFAVLLAACGGGDDAPDKATAKKPAGKRAADAAAPASLAAAEKQLANAVVTGKTTAPVDLKYDVLAKPDVGQPFEIELTFLPRLPADALEVEVTGMPGLTVVNGGAAKFEAVQGGGRDVLKVQARGDEPGLYYLSVVARMMTKVQTEARTFSVPVVVGAVPVAQKVAPTRDAAGQPIESMPAEESGGSAPRQQ